MHLPDEKPIACEPDLGSACPGDILIIQSGKFPSVYSSPHEDQAQRQERTQSKEII